MSHRTRSGLLVALGVTLGFGLTFGPAVCADRQSSSVPLQELRDFAEILERVKSDYVEEVPDEELLHNAIRGMLERLDPHSAYLDADEYEEMQVNTSGRFGGLVGGRGDRYRAAVPDLHAYPLVGRPAARRRDEKIAAGLCGLQGADVGLLPAPAEEIRRLAAWGV
jgi:C-terminal processing protease CtpA/Prc